MEKDDPIRPLESREVFYFSCGPHVPCFNACCRDLNQFLTPYDVLRLARHLEMDSGEFLEGYTRSHHGPQTGLPVVTLCPVAADEKRCPFVTADGCRVYENRPASCRMYPLARMLRRCRQSGQIKESYALICEDHCRGFEQKVPMTAERWIADQGLARYNELNDAMMDIVSVKQQYLPGPVAGDLAKKLYLPLYDIDGFRRKFSERIEPDCRRIGLETGEPANMGDEELLWFAMRYAGQMLRHEYKERQGRQKNADTG